MSTEAKEVKVVINRSAVNAIATAIARGLHTVNGTGSLVTQVCNVARAQFKGKPMPKPDIQAVLDELAESQSWGKNVIRQRQSEYRSVLANYATLPEAMKAFSDRAGKCTWHDGIALSRLLRTHKPNVAAKMHSERGKSKAVDDSKLARSDAKAKAAPMFKRVLKWVKLEREFRDALRELCTEHGIKV